MAAATSINSPAAGNINANVSLVFQGTSDGTINTIIATITNSYGNTVTVYNNGFVSPFTGSVLSISGGSQVTLNTPFNWPLGLLILNTTVTDTAPTTATASRVWTVVTTNPQLNSPPINGQDFSVLVEYEEGGRPLVIEPEIV